MKPRIVVVLALIVPVAAGSLFVATGGRAPGFPSVLSSVGTPPVLEWDALRPPPSPAAERAIRKLDLSIERMTRAQIAETRAVIEKDGVNIVPGLGGRDVVMEGYLVPLDFDAETTGEFLLVAYFGACIHVPPPPPNQVVLVRFDEGVPITSFESQVSTRFRVSGRLEALPATTELADVGYRLQAREIRKIEEGGAG